MEVFRVPTVPVDAQIRYFDERLLVGRIFVPSLSNLHQGPMRPDEWLNQKGLFFPFVPEGSKKAVLLNKRYVVVLTVPAAFAEEDNPELGVATIRKVEVDCGSLQMKGEVAIDMPENQSRLLDFANRAEPFLALVEGDRRHLIQKNRITRLIETED